MDTFWHDGTAVGYIDGSAKSVGKAPILAYDETREIYGAVKEDANDRTNG